MHSYVSLSVHEGNALRVNLSKLSAGLVGQRGSGNSIQGCWLVSHLYALSIIQLTYVDRLLYLVEGFS